MKQLEEAKSGMPVDQQEFISIVGNELRIKIQNGVIPEVGVNGIQANDLIVFTKNLFESLNYNFPCKENGSTITCLENAKFWQDKRTERRQNKGIEGKNIEE